ncbi:unnamed protein product [Prunus armeniaca]
MKILTDFLKIDHLRPKLLISKQAIANLDEEYLSSKTAFYNAQKGRPTLKRQKDGWTSISAWIDASDPGWTGYACNGLGYQHLQLSSFSCKSMPTFEFGRALIYFNPWKAF